MAVWFRGRSGLHVVAGLMPWEAILSALSTVGVALQIGNWSLLRRLSGKIEGKAEDEDVRKLETKFCTHSHEGLDHESRLILGK